MFGGSAARKAISVLVAARIIYAVNWLNIGPVYTLIAPDLHSGVGGLGVLTATFYLGLGIFQVPGGILAARWGPRRVVAVGVMMSSIAVIGTSLSGNVAEVAALRFVVGAGMALVFAPAVVLIAMFISGKKSGMAAGLFNSAYDIGGILGLFAWILIATVTGWRPSLFLSGALGIVTGALIIAGVPKDKKVGLDRRVAPQLRRVLGDRRLLLIGIGILATDTGVSLVATFAVYYMVNALGVAPAIAGLVGGAGVYGVAIFATIWGGRLYDRLQKPKLLMIISNLGVVVAIALCAVPSLYAMIACTVLFGVASSVAFTVAFAAAKDINPLSEEYDSLSVAWVNCIGLFGSFWPPLVFSYLVGFAGYGTAWLGGAGLSLLLTLPLLALREGIDS